MSTLKVLTNHKKKTKRKYLQACLDRRRTFTPLVITLDGAMGTEFKAAAKKMAAHIAQKYISHEWHGQYLVVAGYVQSQISFALIWATNWCIWANRSPIRRNHEVNWAAGDGLPIYR